MNYVYSLFQSCLYAAGNLGYPAENIREEKMRPTPKQTNKQTIAHTLNNEYTHIQTLKGESSLYVKGLQCNNIDTVVHA